MKILQQLIPLPIFKVKNDELAKDHARIPMIQNHRYTQSEDHRPCLELVTERRADWREGRGRRLESTTTRMKQKTFKRIR
jgi:hypothetical protein